MEYKQQIFAGQEKMKKSPQFENGRRNEVNQCFPLNIIFKLETFTLLNDFEVSRRARKCCSTFCSSCLRKKSSNFRMREVSSRHSFPTQNGRNEVNRRDLQFSFQTFGTTESSSQRDYASGIRPQKHEHLVGFC